MKRLIFSIVSIITFIIVWVTSQLGKQAIALPPREDIPEEILRTEIITAARSPLDGKPLTAAEYAELKLQLQQGTTPELSPQIRDQVFLLQIRSTLIKLFPFLHF